MKRHGIRVIEDAVYDALTEDAPTPLAALIPERTIHVTSLSKTVAPGLRIGYLVAPDALVQEGIVGALRASTWMTAPVLASIASDWILGGAAFRALTLLRTELAERNVMAREQLGVVTTPGSPHLWIPLPDLATETTVVLRLAHAGVRVTPGSAFRVGRSARYGFRVCLGAAVSRSALERALRAIIAELANDDHQAGPRII